MSFRYEGLRNMREHWCATRFLGLNNYSVVNFLDLLDLSFKLKKSVGGDGILVSNALPVCNSGTNYLEDFEGAIMERKPVSVSDVDAFMRNNLYDVVDVGDVGSRLWLNKGMPRLYRFARMEGSRDGMDIAHYHSLPAFLEAQKVMGNKLALVGVRPLRTGMSFPVS